MERRGPVLLHATAVALPADEEWVGGAWAGVLLRGPSGSGKSDLALRLIDEGGRLIADDQTELTSAAGVVRMRAPARLAGRMEVRGLGLVEMPVLEEAPLVLVADLADAADIERLPPAQTATIAGVGVAAVRIAPFEASAGAKLRLAAAAAVAGRLGALDRLAAS